MSIGRPIWSRPTPGLRKAGWGGKSVGHRLSMNLLAIYRSPTYSPAQHRENDAAILDQTVDQLGARGWRVERTSEPEVEAGRIPAADLYLNMCQGPLASQRLLPLEQAGAFMVNRPSAVLACH